MVRANIYLLVVIMLVKLQYIHPEAIEFTGVCRRSEICLVLDVSSSIHDDHLALIKEFSKDIVKTLNISSHESKAGLVTFADHATRKIECNAHNSVSSFNADIDVKVQRYGQLTNIEDAILKAKNLLSENGCGVHLPGSPNVTQTMIILTDGAGNTGSHNRTVLNEFAAKVRADSGINMVGIGVGHFVDIEKLTEVVGDADDVFYLKAYSNLIQRDFLVPLLQKACPINTLNFPGESITSTSVSPGKADALSNQLIGDCERREICLVLDVSSSIHDNDFASIKEFSKDIIKAINLTNPSIKAGVVTFADQALRKIECNAHNSVISFNADIDVNVQRFGLLTNIEDAILKAKNLLSENGCGEHLPGSLKATQTMIIVTDGDGNTGSHNRTLLNEFAAKVRVETGINMVGVGVGHSVDIKKITNIVGDTTKVFFPETFNNLLQSEYLVPILQQTCPANTLNFPDAPIVTTMASPIRGEYSRSEICLVLDVSSSIHDDHFALIKEFSKEIIKGFDISNQESKAGLVTFADQATRKIECNDHNSVASFNADMDVKVQRFGQLTNIEDAILKAKQILSENGCGEHLPESPKATQTMIIVTDGEGNTGSHNITLLNEFAAKVRADSGINMVGIGVGHFVQTANLVGIVGDTNKVFFPETFDALLEKDFMLPIFKQLSPINTFNYPLHNFPSVTSTVTKQSTTKEIVTHPLQRNVENENIDHEKSQSAMKSLQGLLHQNQNQNSTALSSLLVNFIKNLIKG